MLRLVYILGEPGTGKTTLMKAVLKELGPSKFFKIKTLLYHQWDKYKVIALGKYAEGEKFAGTDRLSMSVQPQALAVLKSWSEKSDKEGWTVLAEGDRLGNLSFLEAAASLKIKLKLFVLDCDPEVKEERHKERGDTQTETWLKGRVTKIARIRENFTDVPIMVLSNNSKKELLENRDKILSKVQGFKK